MLVNEAFLFLHPLKTTNVDFNIQNCCRWNVSRYWKWLSCDLSHLGVSTFYVNYPSQCKMNKKIYIYPEINPFIFELFMKLKYLMTFIRSVFASLLLFYFFLFLVLYFVDPRCSESSLLMETDFKKSRFSCGCPLKLLICFGICLCPCKVFDWTILTLTKKKKKN